MNYLFSLTNLTEKMFYFDKPHVCVFGCVSERFSLGHYASLFFLGFFRNCSSLCNFGGCCCAGNKLWGALKLMIESTIENLSFWSIK